MMYRRLLASTSSLVLTGMSVRAFSAIPATTRALRPTFRQMSSQRLFMSSNDDFSSPEEIFKALQVSDAFILDVRGPDEIAATGHWKASLSDGNPCGWANMPCSPVDASLLKATAPSMIRDTRCPILVHCASGKRAAKAKEVLEELGYEQVLNVGGWQQVEDYNKST